MKNPNFSIIIPTYNRCYVLWKAIQSILQQTYPYFEIIIVDDGSTDQTHKLIQQFQDPRINYYQLDSNQGASKARNFGLKKAQADLIAYLDSDNTWYPDFLFVMYQAYQKHPEKKIMYCKKNYRLTLVDEEGNQKNVRDEFSKNKNYFDLKRLWQRRILIDTNAMCHKKDEIIELGGWDENLGFWEDWELTLRISEKYPDGFMFLNRTLSSYEQKLSLEKAQETFKFWGQEEAKIFEKHQNNPLLKDQNWFPPRKDNRSTLGVVEMLREMKK